MARGNRGNAWLPHIIFYSVEVFLIAVAALLIFTDADPRLRTSQLEDDTNILDDNPGMSFRPMADGDSETPSSIISYRTSDRNSFQPWVRSLDKFLEHYKRPGLVPGRARNIYNCDYNNPPPPMAVCDVDVKNFDRCITENYFDYHRGAPCVFLRLNTPPGWRPVFYNNSKSLPDEMPFDLKQYIADLARRDPAKLNTIWVSCEGQNPADKEFIGPIQISPMRGFPGYYFLYDKPEGYLSPLVVIHFERPRFGPLINIKCKAWARNIKHDNDTALGGVQFGLMLD